MQMQDSQQLNGKKYLELAFILHRNNTTVVHKLIEIKDIYGFYHVQ